MAARQLSRQLLLDGCLGWTLEDSVPIGIHGLGQAVGLTNRLHQLEVACGVFLVSKECVGHLVGCIVDGRDEHEWWPPPFEPIVVAAVDLEQHTGLRVPLPPAAMTWRATLPRTPLPNRAAQPAYRRAGDEDVVLFAELLGQVSVVVVVVWPPCQLQDPLSYLLWYPVGTWTTAVAVG